MDGNKHFIVSTQKPPKRLFREIIGRLRLEKNLKIFKEKFFILLIIFVISSGLMAAAVQALHSELTESESGSLFLLLFSDTGVILSYFKYFILAVLESIPILSMAISFTALILFMISLKFAVSYYYKISKLNELINSKQHGIKNDNTI